MSLYGAIDTGRFIETPSTPNATIRTDDRHGHASVPSGQHEAHVVGDTPAHPGFHWIHPICSNLKGRARGACHGLRYKRPQDCRDEFAFRFNRNRTGYAAFRSLFALAINAEPMTYTMLISPEPGAQAVWSDFMRVVRHPVSTPFSATGY